MLITLNTVIYKKCLTTRSLEIVIRRTVNYITAGEHIHQQQNERRWWREMPSKEIVYIWHRS